MEGLAAVLCFEGWLVRVIFVNLTFVLNTAMNLSLVEQTQQRILSYITENPECTKLPTEQEFTQILGVSRVVVREALSSLRILGLIETKPKAGSRLVSPDVFSTLKTVISSGLLDDTTTNNLLRLRVILEIGSADYVFDGRTPEMMERIGKLVNEEKLLYIKLISADDCQKAEISRQLSDLDVEFHALLMEMTGNKSLIDFQSVLRHLFSLYPPMIKEYGAEAMSHFGLYTILRTGTADEFRMAMRIHLSALMASIS